MHGRAVMRTGRVTGLKQTRTAGPLQGRASRHIVSTGLGGRGFHVQVTDDRRAGTEFAGYRIESLLGGAE